MELTIREAAVNRFSGTTVVAGERLEFSAEASTLGLGVGEWPAVVIYEGVEFKKSEVWMWNGDLNWIDYSSGESIFRIYND